MPESPGEDPGEGAHQLEQALAEILELPSVDVVALHREAAKSGSFGSWPDHLDPRLLAALERADRARPYTHQAEAISAAVAGRDVVLGTSTASGKSLAYQVPMLNATLRAEGCAHALMVFPTKALARDQVENLRKLIACIDDARIGVAVYDGDTPPDERRAARRGAQIIATNPDMLHRGILPHHEGWSRLLAGLRYVVLDELHMYRGLFGAHVACVMRRLRRVCRRYGSAPTFLASSATIANPRELFAHIIGSPVENVVAVSANGAPSGPRTTVVLNPRVVDETTGVRRDYLKVTRAVADVLRRRQVSTLAFCRTRKGVELLTRYMQDAERADRPAPLRGSSAGASPATAGAVRGYRGGYLPERRREVEAALRSGAAKMVASTNALELGIDIGGIDAVVLSGYPGTRAATLQRLGRAGRRARPALGIVCLSSVPLDQFVAADPSFLFGTPPEHARIDAENPEVLLPHLRCAAREHVFVTADLPHTWAGMPAEELRDGLNYLVEHGALTCLSAQNPPGIAASSYTGHASGVDAAVYAPANTDEPALGVDLRGPLEENFAVLDERTGNILAEVDFEDAPLNIHPGAIYTIEGRTHEVLDLQWDARKAFVRAVQSNYYTEAVSNTQVRIIDLDDHAHTNTPKFGVGMAHRIRKVPGFKKIRFETHENIGFGPVNLPDLELHTVAAYWAVPCLGLEPQLQAAVALGLAHTLHHVAAMLLMCDVADMGRAVTAGHPGSWGPVLIGGRSPSPDALLHAASAPHVVLYDTQAGGAGFSAMAHELGAALIDRVDAIVAGCGCAHGCPVCIGVEVGADATPGDGGSDGAGDIRKLVQAVLQQLRVELEAASCR